MPTHPFYFHSLFFFFLAFLPACQKSNHEQHPDKIEPVAIESFELFANFEEQGLARPTHLEVLPGGEVVVLDAQTNKVHFFDPGGNITVSFGGEGRGPGEFLRASQLLISDDLLYVVDDNLKRINRFTHSGEYLGIFDYDSGMFVSDVLIRDDTYYYIKIMGENESLIKEVNIESGAENYIGEARGGVLHFENIDQERRNLQRGEIPGFMRNDIRKVYSDNHLFVFLTTLSILQKYTIEGQLLWEKEIVMPSNKSIFEYAVEQAISPESIGGIPNLQYIVTMKVVNNETYLLWFTAVDHPQYLVHVDQNGEIKRTFQTPADQFKFFEFSIDHSRDVIYFIDYETSEVYRVPFAGK